MRALLCTQADDDTTICFCFSVSAHEFVLYGITALQYSIANAIYPHCSHVRRIILIPLIYVDVVFRTSHYRLAMYHCMACLYVCFRLFFTKGIHIYNYYDMQPNRCCSHATLSTTL